MPAITIYYHDPIEVDPTTSWTGLCDSLRTATRRHVRTASNPRVLELFGYARPDAVITVDDQPVVSIEQTQMNPSGHNIPQRFSFQVRAAELGVPSILYYPEYSRRTFSDPHVRYVQVRVPLAQKRLSDIFDTPALSVFWPTNKQTLLPETSLRAHQEMASVVGALVNHAGDTSNLLELPEIQAAMSKMRRVVEAHTSEYRTNPSVRRLLPEGFVSARTGTGVSIDPPTKAKLFQTEDLLSSLRVNSRTAPWAEIEEYLRQRPYTLVFTGTANGKRNDSEHPWPGYLTLLDILYLRTDTGRTSRERTANLVYQLPVAVSTFLPRANHHNPPTPTYIVDTFADLIILDGGIVAGRSIRGNIPARAWLSE